MKTENALITQTAQLTHSLSGVDLVVTPPRYGALSIIILLLQLQLLFANSDLRLCILVSC